MALGKQIGKFSLTETSNTVTAGIGRAPTLQANFQGQMSGEAGEGPAFGTMTLEYEPTMKSRRWSYCGLTVFPSGGGNTVNSQGTWEEASPMKFRFRGTAQVSDGPTCGLEFEGDGSAGPMSISGTISEWS